MYQLHKVQQPDYLLRTSYTHIKDTNEVYQLHKVQQPDYLSPCSVCVCVCGCVCKRERGVGGQRERERECGGGGGGGVTEIECVCERDRQTDRQTDRDRETETETETETERDRDRGTETETRRKIERDRDKETHRETEWMRMWQVLGGCFPSSLINHKVLVGVKTSMDQNKTKIKSALRFRPVATKSTCRCEIYVVLAATNTPRKWNKRAVCSPQRTLLARVSISAVRKMIDAKLISPAGLADLELLTREEWATWPLPAVNWLDRISAGGWGEAIDTFVAVKWSLPCRHYVQALSSSSSCPLDRFNLCFDTAFTIALSSSASLKQRRQWRWCIVGIIFLCISI